MSTQFRRLGGVTAQAILTVSAAVLLCTQLCKWAFLPDRAGPIAVLLLSLAGVLFYIWTQGTFVRADGFGYFAAWLNVALSASGVYGFSRASGEALTRLTAPPTTGAGSDATEKPRP
jgi:hypothetical protein